MKEFCIYKQVGSATPYRVESYPTFEKAKESLLIMISDFDYRRKIYYIDNDFFDNKYPPYLSNSIYYQIQVREVTEWKQFKFYENTFEKNNCKILKFRK